MRFDLDLGLLFRQYREKQKKLVTSGFSRAEHWKNNLSLLTTPFMKLLSDDGFYFRLH